MNDWWLPHVSYLVEVGGFACLCDPGEQCQLELRLLVGSPMLDRWKGRGLTIRITSPQGKQVGVGLTTLSIKTVITETLTTTSMYQGLGEGPLDQGYMVWHRAVKAIRKLQC